MEWSAVEPLQPDEMAAVRAYAEEIGRHRSMVEPPSTDRLRTVKEAADAVNCHPETLRRAYRLHHGCGEDCGRRQVHVDGSGEVVAPHWETVD